MSGSTSPALSWRRHFTLTAMYLRPFRVQLSHCPGTHYAGHMTRANQLDNTSAFRALPFQGGMTEYPNDSHSSHMHTEFLLVKNHGKWPIWRSRHARILIMDLMETECVVRWTHMHWSFKISGVEPLSYAGTVFIGIISSSSSSSTESLKLHSMKWQTCLQAYFSLHWCPSGDKLLRNVKIFL
jgi:hypothetical protein